MYKPRARAKTISNLLSKGIVNEDGTPGPNFAQAQRYSVAGQTSCRIGAPAISKSPYSPTNAMPQPNTEGTAATQSDTGAPFKTIAEASAEKDMDPASLDDYGPQATNLPANSLDTRVPGAGTLAGPFPLQGPQLNDDDYTGDTTHRFYTDWQQDDCSVASATKTNSSGCKNDLFPFVMSTYSSSNKSLGNSMGFYNTEQEQAPVLKLVSRWFHLSDNFVVIPRRYRCQPRHAWYRRRCLLDRWSRQSGYAAGEHDRESESRSGHRQPVHGGRQLQRLR